MSVPAFRVSPPGAGQLSADAGAPYVCWFAGEGETLALATAAIGLGMTVEGEAVRVVAPRERLVALEGELASRGSAHARRLGDFLRPVTGWKLRTRTLGLERGLVMGIVNLTEDSFSGDGVGTNVEDALRRAEELRAAGADIIDVGAETARADRPVLDEELEAERVAVAVAALVREGHLVSSDTYKPLVARAALGAGAEIVNDISGLTRGTGAAEEAAKAGAGYVLNYSYSVPKQRPDSPPVYGDVMAETVAWMESRVAELAGVRLARAQVAVDPGIAFGKSHDEDLQMIRRIGELGTLGMPVLLAHSRKNFIGSVAGRVPAERDLETHISSAMAFLQGARIFRVHDVAGAKRAVVMAEALLAEAGRYGPDGTSWPWAAGASASHMTKAEPDKPAPQGQRW